MNKNTRTGGSSPWREPIFWLALALVVASITGSLTLLKLALQDGPIDAVPDPVERTGRAQVVDLVPDERAAAQGLLARLQVDPERGFLQVTLLGSELDPAQTLRLDLRHPVQAAQDRSVTLHLVDAVWQADSRISDQHDWLLQLGPETGDWRLRGRLFRGQVDAVLKPAVDSGRQ